MIKVILFIMATMPLIGTSQEAYWQQEVNYKMQVDVDVERHQLNGNQILLYTNNSPDTLHEIYYHLYFNAFKVGFIILFNIFFSNCSSINLEGE